MTDRSPTSQRVRRAFVAGLAVVYALSFASFLVQADGLIGEQGVLPLSRWLDAVLDHVGGAGLAGAGRAALRAPTLAWVLPDGWAPAVLCVLGLLASGAALFLRAPGPALAAAWTCWLSLVVAGQAFLAFQWDALLCEVGFAALFLVPWRAQAATREAPRAAWWWLRAVLVKLMVLSGVVKLAGGDPTWADLSALTHHYATQPLPNGLSWYAHQLPWPVHAASALAMFLIELVLVWAALGPRRARPIAFAATAVLMGALGLTGNYGIFQLLTVVLALAVLDDGHLEAARARLRALGTRVRDRLRRAPAPKRKARPRRRTVEEDPARPAVRWVEEIPVGALGATLLALSLVAPASELTGLTPPGPVTSAARAVAPFRVANRYGLFARMTTHRPVPILEARWGDGPWTEIPWRWQTSTPDRAPVQVAPHMPRLDWQLWFAGLAGSCDRAPWTRTFLERLLEGSRPVGRLVGDLKLTTSGAPDAVRLVLHDYRFAPGGAWARERGPVFCEARR